MRPAKDQGFSNFRGGPVMRFLRMLRVSRSFYGIFIYFKYETDLIKLR